MAKERDWMDYAQLGLSAAQTMKLSQVADEMGRVAEETARMRHAAESQVKAIRDTHAAQEQKTQKLKQTRQVAWMAEQFLNRLESDTEDETPHQKKYVYAMELEAALKKAELTPPTTLEHWEDMDRVGKLANRLEAFQVMLTKSLTEAQRKEAELCWQYRMEQEELDQMIERRTWLEERRLVLSKEAVSVESESLPTRNMRELKESLAMKKSEMEALDQDPPVLSFHQFLSVVLIFSGFTLTLCGAIGFVMRDEPGQVGLSKPVIIVGLLVTGGVLLVVGFRLKKEDETASERRKATSKGLQDEIRQLEKNLRTAEKLEKVERELAPLNPARFGCHSTDELTKQHDSRRELMKRIMGNENRPSDSAARLQPLPANVTDKVIGYVPDVTPPEGITVEDDEDLMRAWCIEVAKKFNKASVTSLAARDHRDVIDVVVRGNGGVIVKLVSGQVTVICHQLQPKVPEQFLRMLMAKGVIGTTAVAWQKKAYDEGLQGGLCANDVFEIDTVEPERPGAKK